jgi:hypothetical protein
MGPSPRRPAILILATILAALAMSSVTPRAGDFVCAACGHPIDADHVTAGGEHYHPEHFVCALCRRALSGEYVVHEGRNYHSGCYADHVALRCALCGKMLEGRYIEDYWGNAYHERHEGEAPRCEYCMRFISQRLTKGGVTYDDGRVVCRLCTRRAIDRHDDGTALMRSVAATLARFGIDVDARAVALHLVDRPELKRLSGERHALQGFTSFQQTTLQGVRVSATIDVYLLHGLPREEAAATMAHELMHVWLSLRDREQRNAAFAEGSCNYAASLVLGTETGPLSPFILEAMMANDDPAYGKGFRRVKRFAEEKGIARWLEWLATKDRFPAGY